MTTDPQKNETSKPTLKAVEPVSRPSKEEAMAAV